MGEAILVSNCPRCRASKITFDLIKSTPLPRQYGWQPRHEVFCVCRNCNTSTVFVISLLSASDHEYWNKHVPTDSHQSLNQDFNIDSFICLKDMGAAPPPEFVPETIADAFKEGATAVATGCPNAAAAMFRLVIDVTTRPLLPRTEEEGRPNKKVSRDLGLRLPWLFENNLLSRDLEDLSHCIREDGNDGAHAGTLKMADALDLQDFAAALLSRVFSEPARLKLAEERRKKRRSEQEHPDGGS